MPNHFKVLGLTPIATDAEIKSAYRTISARVHPDGSESDLQKFLLVRDAYEVLKEPALRAKYIRQMKMTMTECPVCCGQGVIWKQKGFTQRGALICAACDGAGYD